MNLSELESLAARGEGSELEFKRTTGELREGLQTLCAMLNAKGGRVLFGVDRKGRIEGQGVSEQTRHEIAASFQRFEPPAHVDIERVKLARGNEVLALRVEANAEYVPFTFAGVPYERVGNTTRKMPQARYEALLLKRGHAKSRWENQPAEGVQLEDLDREEILRTRAAAIEQRRITAATSADVGDILDRLGLRLDGRITNAAQVLYGTKFLPYYPQCLLKMGRFRGTKITGDILDNKQEHLHAFAAVQEGMAFLDRTLPLSARFQKMTRYDAAQINREDRLPIPPDGMREILLNAIIHRDYSTASGYVAIAIFDDRVEIQSTGRLLPSITLPELSTAHTSHLRNPLIAGAFHRTGAVETWGRGTNEVIDACRKHGVEPPIFSERTGMLLVTFRAAITAELQTELSAPKAHQVGAMSKRQQAILALVRRKGAVSNHDIRQACKVAEETARKELIALVKANLLIRDGKRRAAKYRLP